MVLSHREFYWQPIEPRKVLMELVVLRQHADLPLVLLLAVLTFQILLLIVQHQIFAITMSAVGVPSARKAKPVLDYVVELLGVEVVLAAGILTEECLWDEGGQVTFYRFPLGAEKAGL